MLKISVKSADEVKVANAKKYSGVYAMGDAPIVVRGLVKALERLDLDGIIEGVNPRNGGERLAVILAVGLKELTGGLDIDVKDLAKVARTIDGVRQMTLLGRGDAHWDDIGINQAVANFMMTTPEPKAKSKKTK
jgi:hypothetical protein